MKEIIENYHADVVRSFRNYQKMAERAIDQVSDVEFFSLIDTEANSIATIESVARGDLGLVRPGEILVTIKDVR